MRFNGPLICEGFEAWNLGPVHPGLYRIFKVEGSLPITMRADRVDVITGFLQKLPRLESEQAEQVLDIVLRDYGNLSAGRLVEISHAPLAPWAMVVKQAKTSIVLGMRIPDRLIMERFKFHKVSVGPERWVGDLDEDSPLAGNRPS